MRAKSKPSFRCNRCGQRWSEQQKDLKPSGGNCGCPACPPPYLPEQAENWWEVGVAAYSANPAAYRCYLCRDMDRKMAKVLAGVQP